MFSKLIISSLLLLNAFTECGVEGKKERLETLTSTLKRLMITVEAEQGDLGAQLEICEAIIAKMQFTQDQLIKESAGLTRTSFNLLGAIKSDKSSSSGEEESQRVLLPYYMRLKELMTEMDQRVRMGLDCVDKMDQVHNDRVEATYLSNDEQAHFTTVQGDIDHIKAEMLETSSNMQQQRDLYRFSSGKFLFQPIQSLLDRVILIYASF